LAKTAPAASLTPLREWREEEIENATAEQLANELAAACECTEDWHRCGLGELQERVRRLVAMFARTEADDTNY